MILLAPDKTSVAGAMGPEEVEFFEQVTHHLCAIILTVGAVLRRFLKRSFGQVRNNALCCCLLGGTTEVPVLVGIHTVCKRGCVLEAGS